LARVDAAVVCPAVPADRVHATLSFLEQIAGLFRTRETALIRAIDALIASREQWKAAVGEYAQRRTSAKRHGQRVATDQPR
jgi:hypothetical protein